MAGSYRHITDHNNKFIGTELIDNLGDAYEALEECHQMIVILSGGDMNKIHEAHQEYLRITGSDYISTYEDFWENMDDEGD